MSKTRSFETADQCSIYYRRQLNPQNYRGLTVWIHEQDTPSRAPFIRPLASFTSLTSPWIFIILYCPPQHIAQPWGYVRLTQCILDLVGPPIIYQNMCQSTTPPLLSLSVERKGFLFYPSLIGNPKHDQECTRQDMMKSVIQRVKWYNNKDLDTISLAIDPHSLYINRLGWNFIVLALTLRYPEPCHPYAYRNGEEELTMKTPFKKVVHHIIQCEVRMFVERMRTCWQPYLYEIFIDLLTQLNIDYKVSTSLLHDDPYLTEADKNHSVRVHVPFECIPPYKLMKRRTLLYQGYDAFHYGNMQSSIGWYYQRLLTAHLIPECKHITKGKQSPLPEGIQPFLAGAMKLVIKHLNQTATSADNTTGRRSTEEIYQAGPLCVKRFIDAMKQPTSDGRDPYYLRDSNRVVLYSVLLSCGMDPDELQEWMMRRTEMVYHPNVVKSKQNGITEAIKWWTKEENKGKEYSCASIIASTQFCGHTKPTQIEDLGLTPQQCCTKQLHNRPPLPITKPSQYITIALQA